MMSKSTWLLFFLALLSPHGAFKVIRPCFATSNLLKSNVGNLRSDALYAQKNLPSANADIIMAASDAPPQSLASKSDNPFSFLQSVNWKRVAASSAILGLFALGFQQSANAGVLETIQEKVNISLRYITLQFYENERLS